MNFDYYEELLLGLQMDEMGVSNADQTIEQLNRLMNSIANNNNDNNNRNNNNDDNNNDDNDNDTYTDESSSTHSSSDDNDENEENEENNDQEDNNMPELNFPSENVLRDLNNISGLFRNVIQSDEGGHIRGIAFYARFQSNIGNPMEHNFEDVQVVMDNNDIEKYNKNKVSYNELLLGENSSEINSDMVCTICLANIIPSNIESFDEKQFIKLDCNHIYHSECILEWFKNYNYICPNCKCECGKKFYKL